MVTLKKNESTVVVAALALILYTLSLSMISQVTSSSLQSSRAVSNVGEVKAIGVGIFWDQGCTTEVSSINWGVIEPGSSKNVTVYIRNEGNSAVSLTMNVSNWTPLNAPDYMDLGWNYEGQFINVSEVLEVTFTLAISSETQGITSFSFDIVIIGNF